MGMRRPRGVLGSLGEDCRGSGKLLGGSCGLYMRRTLVAKGVLGVFDVAAMGALLGGLGGHDYDDRTTYVGAVRVALTARGTPWPQPVHVTSVLPSGGRWQGPSPQHGDRGQS